MMQDNLFGKGPAGPTTEAPRLSIGMTLYTRKDLDKEAQAAADADAYRAGKTLIRKKPTWTLAVANAGDGTRISLIVVYRTTDQDASAPDHTTNMAI